MTTQQHREIMGAIAGVATEVVALGHRVGLVEGRLGRLEERMDRLEERMDRLEERMDRLEERMDRLEERMDRVEAAVACLEQTMVTGHRELVAHIDRVYVELSGRVTDLEKHRVVRRVPRTH